MIGDGINRTDGPLKVTGRAPYSYERRDAGPALYGVIRGSSIALGRVLDVDTKAAEAAPGVRLVLTHKNAPAQADFVHKRDMFDPNPQLKDDRITRYGQPVAFVVADTFEQARAAAALVEVTYSPEPTSYDIAALAATATHKNESRIGDLDRALAEAPTAIDATYTTPYHFSQPMELNACIAEWRDGHLTLYLTSQIIAKLREALADTLKLQRRDVTIDAAFIGGGFGSKIGLHAEAVLASLGTMALGRPVKVQMSRRQIFTLVGHRPETISRVRLAAGADGRLKGLGHDATIQTSSEDDWGETVAEVARALYAAPHRLTRHAYATVEVGAAQPVRGPGEVAGLLAIESAMDELAEKLAIDPIELRLRNDTNLDPEKNRPLSGRRLAECLREGADRFGWADRPIKPASRRDGDWLIGYGVASSIRGHLQNEAEAKVRIEPDGQVIVRSDMTDLGTGTYTIVAQIVGAALDVPVSQVKVELARTDYPRGWGSGGSWGAANTSVAVDRACDALKDAVRVVAGTGYNDIFAEVRRHFPLGLEATGKTLKSGDDPNYQSHSQFTYGATFIEVAVDAFTAEVRVRRMLGVFSAGRIINRKTARSQLIGGMIWGIGAALQEDAKVDPRYGHWVNGDFAEYLIPVHADVPDVEAIMLDDFDEHANHLGIKGIGELGTGGTAASIANAVYNATGVRVRNFPITLSKLLPGMPAVS